MKVSPSQSQGSFGVSFKHEGETKHVTSDLALFGTLGRTPNTSGLGLERQSVQVDPNHGGIVVNDQHETSQAGIFAVGDVLGRAQLTPLAIRAELLADRLFDQRDVAVNYDLIPTAVFTTPPIGTVGLSESEALLTASEEIWPRYSRPISGDSNTRLPQRRDSPNLYETHPA